MELSASQDINGNNDAAASIAKSTGIRIVATSNGQVQCEDLATANKKAYLYLLRIAQYVQVEYLN